MTVFEKIVDMWPQERMRDLYLPEDIARQLSFFSIEEAAEMLELCPKQMPIKGIQVICGRKISTECIVCKKCRQAYLASLCGIQGGHVA